MNSSAHTQVAASAHQLGDVLAKLDVDAPISKAEALQPFCRALMNFVLSFLVLVPDEPSQRPLIICSRSKKMLE